VLPRPADLLATAFCIPVGGAIQTAGIQNGTNQPRLLRHFLSCRSTHALDSWRVSWPAGSHSNAKACRLNITRLLSLVYATVKGHPSRQTFAYPHCMSTWSSSRNIEERCWTLTPSSGSKPFSKRSAATSRLNWLKWTAKPNTYTCSSTTAQALGVECGQQPQRCFQSPAPYRTPGHGETLLEQCPVVAFLLRRQRWRGTAGHD